MKPITDRQDAVANASSMDSISADIILTKSKPATSKDVTVNPNRCTCFVNDVFCVADSNSGTREAI